MGASTLTLFLTSLGSLAVADGKASLTLMTEHRRRNCDVVCLEHSVWLLPFGLADYAVPG